MHSVDPIRVTAVAAVGRFAAYGIHPVHAAETTCAGALVGITVDKLRVPGGRSCSLDATG